MSTLYPLKFKPIFKEKIWGGNRLKTVLNKPIKSSIIGESWEISAVRGNISKVINSYLKGNNLEELIEVYMGDLVGDQVFKKYGIEFPLLFKFIDANDKLSIQVHPDDKLAQERHNAYGKTEMWYVIDTENNAELISGFNSNVSREIYLQHLKKGNLLPLLNIEKTVSGDSFFIPAGRVHAIGSGNLLAEIQQTSDITYRIFDYNRLEDGRPRELHTQLALDAIDFQETKNAKCNYPVKVNQKSNIVTCPYFTTNIINFDKNVSLDYSKLDSFVVFMCIQGNCTINFEHGTEIISKGETVLLPAEIKNIELVPEHSATILETYIEEIINQ